MKIYAEATSGYLYKWSGMDWQNCLDWVPSAVVGGDLIVGKRYWIADRPPAQYWKLWRSFLSFPTGFLGTQIIRSAWLVFTVKERGADFDGTILLFRQGSTSWGSELDADDWDACEVFEGLYSPAGFTGEVWKSIDPASIETLRNTQFRLVQRGRAEPTGDEYAVLYGADDAERRPYLVIESESINDGVCINLAAVLTLHQSDLAVNAIHSDMRHTVDEVPEIQIGWDGKSTRDPEREGYQLCSVTIWWLGEQIDSTAALMSRDREQRQKADLITRILLKDRDCNGYCTEIYSIEESLPDLIEWPSGSEYIGVVVTVTYRLEIGDMEML